MKTSKPKPQDTKKVFWKCGTCSRTFFYLLNREFGHNKEAEERSSDPLAGGLMNTGHQCGMLWGSSLAVGAESVRRHRDRNQANAVAISATRHIMESYTKSNKTVNCREITGCNLTSRWGMAKLGLMTILSGIYNSRCFVIAENWAPEAMQAAHEGLAQKTGKLTEKPVSCASVVAKKMGASDYEMDTVAGFAGGMGLSGNACGALGAAIWMKSLARNRKNPDKIPPYFKDPALKNIIETFYRATGSEILCQRICGRSFKDIDDHTEFIKNGGCNTLIDTLAKS
jgi:hypothetical protein